MRNDEANSLQDTLASHQFFLIHIQSFPFPLEHLSLHLTLEISTQRCFLLSLLLNPPLIVLIVANLANRSQSLRTDLGYTSCCLHVFRSDLLSHHSSVLVGGFIGGTACR